jgi:hypothetical protein
MIIDTSKLASVPGTVALNAVLSKVMVKLYVAGTPLQYFIDKDCEVGRIRVIESIRWGRRTGTKTAVFYAGTTSTVVARKEFTAIVPSKPEILAWLATDCPYINRIVDGAAESTWIAFT